MEAVDTVCLIGRVLERCPQGLLLCDCCTGQRVMVRTDQACRFCPGDLVRVRRGAYGCEGLIRDRAAFQRKYRNLLVEKTTLEDIMLFIGKGDAV